MTDNKLTITEAARHFKVTERTIRRWIESGKLASERTNGQRFVTLDIVTQTCPNDRQMDNNRSIRLEAENKSLREQLLRADGEVQRLGQQLSRRDEQIDHLTQLLALKEKNVAALTEQISTQRTVIEDMRRPKKLRSSLTSLWQRVFRIKAVR